MDYLAIGHNANAELWWMDGGKLRTRPVQQNGVPGCHLSVAEYESIGGRIDHDNRTISLRFHGGLPQRAEFARKLLQRQYPAYRIHDF